jgi:ATP-dependent DNA ligase
MREAHWVTPVLVGEVEYRELTSDQRLDYEPSRVRVPAQ